MSSLATAVIGGAVIGGYATKEAGKKAAKGSEAAAAAQVESSEAAIAEEARQFDEIKALLAPYVEMGEQAITGQSDLIGLGGPEAQQQAISGIETSPQFQSIVQQGEEAILQNASATGGLRGGNTQAALAQFRPQILSQLIESQFQKLGQIGSLGQASAAGQAAMGQQSSSNISNLLTQQGQARAGNALAMGNIQAQTIGGFGANLGNAISTIGTLKALKAF